MSFFSGTTNFDLLNRTIDKVLRDALSRWNQSKDTSPDARGCVIDLRREIIDIFQSIVTIFLFGTDVSQEMMTMSVVQHDGSIIKKDKSFFEALENAMDCGSVATVHRSMFGERKITSLNTASIDNWNNYLDFVQKVVN